MSVWLVVSFKLKCICVCCSLSIEINKVASGVRTGGGEKGDFLLLLERGDLCGASEGRIEEGNRWWLVGGRKTID